MLQQLRLHRRNLYWVGGISALIALLVVWTFAIEWEWSFIGDDAGWIQTVRSSVASGNIFSPILQSPGWAWSEATSWGLFRPTSIVYYAMIYQLPVDWAHLIRLLMFLVALATPLILAFRRNDGSGLLWPLIWLLSLGLANYTMAYGAYFVSLSELTAIFLVAIGLLVPYQYLRVILFLLAALAKAPFIWLALVYVIYLIWQKTSRMAGLVGLALGIPALVAIIYASQVGSYTSKLTLNPWHFLKNIEQLGSYGAIFLGVLFVGLFALLPTIKPTPMTFVLLVGALLFAGNLLAWNTIGYYNAPVWFLITCAMATAVRLPAPNPLTVGTFARAALIFCLLGATLLSAETFRVDIFGRNTMVIESRDWVLANVTSQDQYFIYDFGSHEFQFYLTEKDPQWPLSTPPRWGAGQPRPPETKTAEFVVATNEVPLTPELTKCPPIKVWTRGFLAPLRC